MAGVFLGPQISHLKGIKKKIEKQVYCTFMQLCLPECKQQMIAPSKSCFLTNKKRDQGLKGLAIWGGIVELLMLGNER